MARNNIKILTAEQLVHFNNRYSFLVDGDDIVVKINGYTRETRHPKSQPFAINARKVRKLCFSMEAINIWIDLCNDGCSWTLVDVQNAVNVLYIMCQKIDTETVKQLLLKGNVTLN